MRAFTILGWLMVPVFVFLLTIQGCKKAKDDDDDEPARPKRTSQKDTRTPLKANLDGTIKGRVTFKGELPAVEMIAAMNKHDDKAHCLKGSESEKIVQTWLIDKETKGVANVLISLKPPDGKYFELNEAARKPAEMVVKLRQPHCAFIPHVLALFPKYYDGKESKETGQKLEIVNDANMTHNTRWEGNPMFNEKSNLTLPASQSRSVVLNPQKTPLNFGCDIHGWMSAKVWALDNPFFAVTDAKGNFEIKNVPIGVEVTVVGWHEGKPDFFNETRTFKKGDNPLNLEISQ